MEAEFVEGRIFLYCPACRATYSKGSISEPCPKCGKREWSCIFDTRVIIDAFEDQEALRMLIDNCDAEEVRDTARIMGYFCGDCCTARDDNGRIEKLRERFGEPHA